MAITGLDELLKQGVHGQRVLVRADLNVPLRDGAVSDDTRIRASLPTLRRLLDAGARVIVTSHLGRPKGERRPELSLRPVAPRLAQLLGAGVSFCEECVGERAAAAIAELGDGQLILLENLRFHAGETQNDPDFARALAELAEVYVNDAFGTAHRAHASTEGITAHMERVAAGYLLKTTS
jgi:phosphoglycerate kinase